MGQNLKASPYLLVAALLTLVTVPAYGQSAANLRVDGVAENMHVLDFTPTFCWDFSGTQQNWHIQVDDDSGFIPNSNFATPQVAFWDSGEQDKGAANTDRCAELPAIRLANSTAVTLDRRAFHIYWRLRVKANGAWGPWVNSVTKMNQYPLMARDMAVAADPVSSIDPVEPVPAAVTAKSFYVSPQGNDSAGGTLSAPFRTIARAARALGKGDTLFVRGGNYDENVEITPAAGYVTGEPNNPVTVKAYQSERPVIRALSTGNQTALRVGGGLTDWVFDGLTLGGASARYGVYVSGGSDITISGCRLDSSLPLSTTAGIFVSDGASDIRIQNCVFDQFVQDQIEISGGSHVEIRGNEFTRCQRRCIQAHGSAPKNLVIADNRFHDISTIGEGAIFLYIGSAGTRVVNNVFENITKTANVPPNGTSSSVLAWGVSVLRSGEVTVENNTFYNLTDYGILLFEATSHGTYRNNIFMKVGSAIRFRGGSYPGSSAIGATLDHNIFYQNNADVTIAASETSMLDHAPTGNCYGGPPPGNAACDPRFANAASGDFSLQAGSPAIDAGDPSSPVPVGGGARVDIGRFEAGASATVPYEYEPRFTVQDPTPRITWRIFDVDNELERVYNMLPPGDVDFQTKYQVQIDPRPTFDSLGPARPLIDSGEVTTSTEGFTVPDARSLAPGDYYVRVRQTDDHDFTVGSWSDHNFRFRVSASGPQPPYLSGLSPASGAQGVSPTATIGLHVRDDSPGVNASTIRVYVDGTLVTPSITGSANDYTVSYTPSSPFGSGSLVTVRVTASDLGSPALTLDTTYTFTVRDSVAPLPPANVRIIQ